MKHRAMPDVAIVLHQHILSGKAMDRAIVLDVGACLEDNAPDVAAERCARAHQAARTDDHIADEHRRGMHEGSGIHDWPKVFKLVTWHKECDMRNLPHHAFLRRPTCS